MKNSFEIVNEAMRNQPVDLDQLCSDLNIKLSRLSLPDTMSGKIERKDDDSFEISVNSSHGPYRQRFTIAHEIGHFILHRHLMGTGIGDSIAYRADDSGLKNSNIKPLHEAEANRFAAALLLPKDLVIDRYNNVTRDVCELAEYFHVSQQAMTIRLRTFKLTV